MTTTAQRETLGFQAEVKQLLHLMVHSLYGNKEIFLRELVSNASDAGDKLRFEALADPALFENDPDLKIRVSYDKTARTITVSDNGIGMSRQEVIDQIGTIAKSGTREFFQSLTSDKAKDAHLIGQFGVGFYSAFIVADRVTLTTRRAGLTAEHGVRWESTGEGEYTVETVNKESRGTDVVLHLRPEEDELLAGFKLREILRKYLRPHHRSDRDEEGTVGLHGEGAGPDRRGRADQSGLCAVGALQVRDHRRAVRRVLQARRPRLRGAARARARQGRRPSGIHAAALRAETGAVRSLEPRASPRHQALRPSRVHHGRCGAADAAVPALRARGDRLERSAAQRVARDPAAVARCRGHQDDVRQARARPARRARQQGGRQVRDVLERVRSRAQGRASSRTPPIAIASRSCFASHRRSARPTSRRSRCPTTSAG